MREHRNTIALLALSIVAFAGVWAAGYDKYGWVLQVLAIPMGLVGIGMSVTTSVRNTTIEAIDAFAGPVEKLDSVVRFDQRAALVSLEAIGFARAGAVRMVSGNDESVLPVLLAADRQTFAVVTNHLLLLSEYGGKLLSTATSGLSKAQPFELQQSFPRSGVSELFARHQQTISQIRASSGRVPIDLDPTQAVEVFIASERNTIRNISTMAQIVAMVSALFRGRRRDPLRSGAELPIQRWLNGEDDYRIA